jgi:exosome complex component RRP45
VTHPFHSPFVVARVTKRVSSEFVVVVSFAPSAAAAASPSLRARRAAMRPFSTDADALVCLNNREFIVSALQGDEEGGPFRVDGREPHETRASADKLSIKLGPVEGVCVVRLGNTIACANTTGVLEKPTSGGASSEGSLRVDVDFSSGACEGFAKDGRASQKTRQRAKDLGALLERGLKEARAVDVESLCVLAGKRVWVITCSVTILAHDGNLAGAASLAACGSLMTYRRPECAVDPNSGMVTVHGMDDREAIPLNMHHFPIASTYCFFDEAPGLAVVDPTLEEEVTADSSVVVVVNTHEEVCAISKSGVGVRSEDVKSCVRASSRTAKAWTELLKEAAAEFEANRLANKVRTHYEGYNDAPDDDYLLDAFYKPGDELNFEADDDDAKDEDEPQSDSAEDEESDDDDDADAADGDETMRDVDDVFTKKGKNPTKPSKRKDPVEESDEETKFCEDDDIDALFEKAEKKKKKTLASWDDLPGDADDLSKALKPRKKLKSVKKSKKTGKK